MQPVAVGGATRLVLLRAGLVDYGEALALQEDLHARVVAGEAAAYAVSVEHPPVLTFGKHASAQHLLFAAEALRAQGIGLVQTERGGEVTAHEPGQLVLYPILRLASFGLRPKRYVELLEGVVIEALRHFDVTAATDPEHPGVWVGREKICAIGIRIKERVSLHGMALNVANSLELFQKIVPCGIQGRGVTSVSRVCGRGVTVDEVLPQVEKVLASALGMPEAQVDVKRHLQWHHGAFTIPS